jgi:pimeloyl-ACP methyl ester carboxylesterase
MVHDTTMQQDQPHPAQWRLCAVERPDVAMRAQEAGAGAPLLCLGFDDPSACRMCDDLAQTFRMIALAPAAAPLDATPEPESATLARDALACADALGLTAFPLLARGDETHAALRLALDAPARLHALALVAPDLHSHDGAARDADLLEELAHVRTPALAAFGALDRAAARNARLLRERLPHCRIALLRDAGAQPDGERPHALARMIASFLRAPAAFSASNDPGWSHGFSP